LSSDNLTNRKQAGERISMWNIRIYESTAIFLKDSPISLPYRQREEVCYKDVKGIRELLVNVVRHTRAGAVRVSIQKAGDEIQVTVEDDGVGFLSSSLDLSLSQGERGGFGLFNIQERLEYLGGKLKVKSAPGEGTCVILTAPLKWQNNTLNVGRH